MPATCGTDIEQAVGHQRAGPDNRAEQPGWLAGRLASCAVKGMYLRAVFGEIDAVADHNRHRLAVDDCLPLPDPIGAGDITIAFERNLDGRPHRGVVKVFLGLRHEDAVSGH